jgi:LmbE family N-acetylglucosaminyl deacetylase
MGEAKRNADGINYPSTPLTEIFHPFWFMRWIYLSPHLDDGVLSCGGMIWEQSQRGENVEIWTLCAGYPPKNVELTEFAAWKHREWKIDRRVVFYRREEDRLACSRVGAGLRWWSLPDCIYRRLPNGEALVTSNDSLWLPVHPGEQTLVARLRVWLRRNLSPEDRLVCPLTLGNHVDHRLTRAAAESLRRRLYYCADFPYAARDTLRIGTGLADEGIYRQPVSQAGLRAWQAGVAAYSSQVADLFGSEEAMRAQVEDYWERGGGSFLWLQ